MDNLKLRLARPGDAEKLLEIYSYYVLNTAITFEITVPSADEFRGRIENILKKYPYFVAEIGGVPVGYAYAGAFVGREAYCYSVETSVYVRRDLRGRGIGKILYNTLENALKEMNITNMIARVSCPEEDDEYLTGNSISFHKAMGFRYMGELHKCGHKFGRWYNSACMEKIINEHAQNPEPVRSFDKTEAYGRINEVK